ncbi:hypothetical protein SRB17_78870 [Streptomyces sp. RB17]|uniref:hypothetical protein n=1 Tax=Streptomyces sp. RB17 TaxID=2585197 RepID=UPI001296C5BE|nr:hypothetical protein [Streptomyces sp. RB17]MQY39859.1 hypothetical protein [Streptomyces sp. RB17]
MSTEATAWMDTLWDPEARLLRTPRPADPPTHMVRETVWYAVGLLTRRSTGDLERATEALHAVLGHQYDVPGTVFHGTWRRSPDEADPGAEPVEWRDYDPNWREFIGTALLLILHHFETDLPADLVARIDSALVLAAEGSVRRGVRPDYTNIAVMAAYLYDSVGRRFGLPPAMRAGESLARRVHTLWSATTAFPEFNSPTYYGVDLYGLGLWGAASGSPVLWSLGTDMETALWREIADRYHPGLRNIAGPYDRAYGMDMQQYAALLGLWIGLVAGPDAAPLPSGGPEAAGHAHDWCFAPCFALLGVVPPEDVTARLGQDVVRPRYMATTISESPRRVATSWLGERLMIGALDAAGEGTPWGDQHCPVTVHWRAPDGGPVRWLRAAPQSPVDAAVDRDGCLRLRIRSSEPVRFEVHTPGSAPAVLAPGHWRLPGLGVRAVESQECFDVRTTSSRDGTFVEYRPTEGAPTLSLRFLTS